MDIYFSANLKYLRKKNKLDQGEVAKKLGISQSYYSDWENSKKVPDIIQASKVKEIYDIPNSKDIINCNLKLEEDIEEVIKDFVSKTKGQISKQDRDQIEFIIRKTLEEYES